MAEVAEYEGWGGGALGCSGGGRELVRWREFDDAYAELIGATFKADGNHRRGWSLEI